MDLEYRMIEPCYFGAESAAAFDIRRIGAKDVTVTDGRVAFTGGTDVLAAANLHSRCAERILLLLKTGRAMTFDELFNLAYSVPWEELMPADAAFPVKGSSLSSQLSSVPACQSIVKKAVVERLKKGHRVQALPESGGEYRIRRGAAQARLPQAEHAGPHQRDAGLRHAGFRPHLPGQHRAGPILRQRHAVH